jgi:hypothetical protein
MAINIFTQFGVRAGGSIEYAYAFATPSAWTNNASCSPVGYDTCDENNYVENGNNTKTECQCVFGSWGNFTTRTSFTSNLPTCGQGVVQSRALTRTRTGSTSSFAYSERTNVSGTLVGGNWTCQNFTQQLQSSTETVTSCVYTVTDQFIQPGGCSGLNYDRGCLSSGTRSDCRSTCFISGSFAVIETFSCAVETSQQTVQSCGGSTSFGSTFTSSSNQSQSPTPGNGCQGVSCSQNISCNNLSVTYTQFAFGQCTGAFYSDDCNYAVCNNYSGTTCNFSSWSGWSQTTSCTESKPGCSNGVTQRECASETRTGQIQSRTVECVRTELP